MLKKIILALALVGSAADPCADLTGEGPDACNRCCEESTPSFVVDCADYRCAWDVENPACGDRRKLSRNLRFGDIEPPKLSCCKTIPSNAVCPINQP